MEFGLKHVFVLLNFLLFSCGGSGQSSTTGFKYVVCTSTNVKFLYIYEIDCSEQGTSTFSGKRYNKRSTPPDFAECRFRPDMKVNPVLSGDTYFCSHEDNRFFYEKGHEQGGFVLDDNLEFVSCTLSHFGNSSTAQSCSDQVNYYKELLDRTDFEN